MSSGPSHVIKANTCDLVSARVDGACVCLVVCMVRTLHYLSLLLPSKDTASSSAAAQMSKTYASTGFQPNKALPRGFRAFDRMNSLGLDAVPNQEIEKKVDNFFKTADQKTHDLWTAQSGSFIDIFKEVVMEATTKQPSGLGISKGNAQSS